MDANYLKHAVGPSLTAALTSLLAHPHPTQVTDPIHHVARHLLHGDHAINQQMAWKKEMARVDQMVEVERIRVKRDWEHKKKIGATLEEGIEKMFKRAADKKLKEEEEKARKEEAVKAAAALEGIVGEGDAAAVGDATTAGRTGNTVRSSTVAAPVAPPAPIAEAVRTSVVAEEPPAQQTSEFSLKKPVLQRASIATMFTFKYTSARASPLPPVRPLQAKGGGDKVPNISSSYTVVQNNKNEPTPLHQATRTFSSNLLLFPAVEEKGPKLATAFLSGGKSDKSLSTREATMSLYERHSAVYDHIAF
ncbi:hypothetical protein HDU79_002829 [Rhizoclosmatium sp. JEL0117]|nr:hypothetical protein HDU79_002829 [Rhizoclosmatium sp. JEL0117]